MTPALAIRRLAQQILNTRIGARLEVDGAFGRVSMAAAAKWIPWTFKGSATAARWVAAVIQKEAVIRAINSGAADAYYGPQTADAANRILIQIHGLIQPVRPDEEHDEVSSARSGIRCWSPSSAQFRARYGRVGENQGMVQSPYPLRLDWDLDTVVHRFSAHESLVTRAESAMKEILAHYTLEGIRKLGLDRFGGCLNVRLKRGGTTPSVHSWGAANDWFPSKNQLKQTRRSALFAREDYDAFLNIWEKYGYMSLGRCFDFDWMHQQANP